jgi:hypothetical protein
MFGNDSTSIGPSAPQASEDKTARRDDAGPEESSDSTGPAAARKPGDEEQNPYLVGTAQTAATDGSRRVEELDTVRCWQLLESATLGRLAIKGRDGHPDMFPVNYLVHNGNIFIRSAPGTKLRSIAKHPEVAFEIDGETTNYHWSVIVHASAHRLDVDTDIEASGVLGLISANPTSKENFIRLTPETVTGRRFPKRNRPGMARTPLSESPVEGRDGRNLKPDPIPHFAPLREE